MNIPKYLWREAVLTASYLINVMPTCVLNLAIPVDNFKSVYLISRLYIPLDVKT